MDVEKFVRHLCRLVLRHQMPVWNYFVNSFYSAIPSLTSYRFTETTHYLPSPLGASSKQPSTFPNLLLLHRNNPVPSLASWGFIKTTQYLP
jgi:hypothetical protein